MNDSYPVISYKMKVSLALKLENWLRVFYAFFLKLKIGFSNDKVKFFLEYKVDTIEFQYNTGKCSFQDLEIDQ